MYEEGISCSLFEDIIGAHENLLIANVDNLRPEGIASAERLAFLTYSMKGTAREAYDILESKTAGYVQCTVGYNCEQSQMTWYDILVNDEYSSILRKYEMALSERRKVLLNWIKEKEATFSFELLPFNSGFHFLLKPKAKYTNLPYKDDKVCVIESSEMTLVHSYELTKMLSELLLSKGFGVATLGGYIRVALSALSCATLTELLKALQTEYDNI